MSSRNFATGSSYSSMRTTIFPFGDFAAAADRKSSNCPETGPSPSYGMPAWAQSPLTSFASRSMNSSYVSPTALDIVKPYTGVGCSQPSHGNSSSASPLNSSRRPSNIALSVESMSDLPNRRGREMNSCWSASLQSRYSRSVLSTYFPFPPSMRLGKSNTPVVGILIVCALRSICEHCTTTRDSMQPRFSARHLFS